ncbi:MAG TPA: hypothetical protein VK157_13130 [Phycisphaerales bacterium]|nr:hypothetical protein [Phycisphaerales bacterium]
MQSRITLANALTGTLACNLIAPLAVAQPVATATSTWQISADNGGTWQSGTVSLSQSQQSIRARMLVEVTSQGFTNPAHFAHAQFETYLTSSFGAGLNDTISSVRSLRTFVTGPQLVSVVSRSDRFGEILKTSAPSNQPFAPGSGPSLFAENQRTPTSGVPSAINPLVVFEYTIMLDGSLGTRSLSTLWRGGSTQSTPAIIAPLGSIIVGDFANSPTGTIAIAPMTDIPATITVIPAPGAAIVFACAAAISLRRRR